MNRQVSPAGVIVCALCFQLIAVPAVAQVDQVRAATYFEEAAVICDHEAGRLWGVSLCGPMVFSDAVTGTIATNQAAPEEPRPRVLGYANTALEWGEVRWSTFVWQMIPVDDDAARTRLLMHELFHRVQPDLGLFVAVIPGENEHLDTLEGRYWMQLEWRALARALGLSGVERTDAVRDALAFRMARRALFRGSAEREQASEINEGLAQYTATVSVAASTEEAAAAAIEQLTKAPERESFVRTFAYPTGTAYGILLDAWSPGWTRHVAATDDLGQILMAATGFEPTPDTEAAAQQYGGLELWTAEEQREAQRKARVAALSARFIEGPVLVVPRGRGASFITTGLTPIPGAGTIYPSYRVTAEWGSIEAEQVLVAEDGNTLTVPGPFTAEGSTLTGDGWTVVLASGWTVHPGRRAGDFAVAQEE